MIEKDGNLDIEVQLPGVDKKDILLTFDPEENIFLLNVEGRERPIYLNRQIDGEKVTAVLALGVLKIRAPIKNTRRTIKIN